MKQTCEKLKKTFLSLLEQQKTEDITSIKIKDLIAAAGIARSTFYANYENLDSLIEDMIDDFLQNVEEKVHSSLSSRPLCLCPFSHAIVENQNFLSLLYHSKYQAYLLQNIRRSLAHLVSYQFQTKKLSLDNLYQQSSFLSPCLCQLYCRRAGKTKPHTDSTGGSPAACQHRKHKPTVIPSLFLSKMQLSQ